MRPKDLTARLLKAILISVDSLRTSLDKQTEAISKNTQAQNTQREPNPKSAVEVPIRLPVAVTKYYESQYADQRRHERRSNIKFWLEITAVGAAVAAAIFTLITLIETQNQVTIMRQQLEMTDRPWIRITSAEPTHALTFMNMNTPEGPIASVVSPN